MNNNKKIIKIFENEKNGVKEILNNLNLNDLPIFSKLCIKAKKAIKDKKK